MLEWIANAPLWFWILFGPELLAIVGGAVILLCMIPVMVVSAVIDRVQGGD